MPLSGGEIFYETVRDWEKPREPSYKTAKHLSNTSLDRAGYHSGNAPDFELLSSSVGRGFLWFSSASMGSTVYINAGNVPSLDQECFQIISNSSARQTSHAIQDVPGGNANILGGHSIGHSKQKEVYMYMCPIPNGFRDTAISLYSTLYTVQRSKTPCPHTSCKVHWCWRWNFWKCIILGKLYQLCHLNNKYRY
jgi:hypothetical protein